MINKFRGEYFFLSNFYPCKILYKEIEFLSSEHAYQAEKTSDKSIKIYISKLSTKEAKDFGKTVRLIQNWNNIKLNIMEEILKIKFTNEELKKLLISTKNQELIEENTWNDIYWGICDGIGENNLGKLLMKIRNELN